MSESFSSRNNFTAPPPITTWYDAPPDLRYALTVIVRDDCGQGARWTRDAVCSILRTEPDNNWSEEPLMAEANHLVRGCPWYKVYDLAEGLHQRLAAIDSAQGRSRRQPGPAETFQARLNETMADKGIGWTMAEGKLQIRGEPAQQTVIEKAQESLDGFPAAERRLEEAFQDLSRRPEADIEGAITHAFAALESVCGKITGTSGATFGDIIKANQSLFPQPMGSALEKMWGYASNHARHQTEHRKPPDIHEAYLLVGTIAAAIIYVTKRIESQAP